MQKVGMEIEIEIKSLGGGVLHEALIEAVAHGGIDVAQAAGRECESEQDLDLFETRPVCTPSLRAGLRRHLCNCDRSSSDPEKKNKGTDFVFQRKEKKFERNWFDHFFRLMRDGSRWAVQWDFFLIVGS
jgi:hypothetical protein